MGAKIMTLVTIAVSVFLLFGLFGCDQKTDTNTSGTNDKNTNNTSPLNVGVISQPGNSGTATDTTTSTSSDNIGGALLSKPCDYFPKDTVAVQLTNKQIYEVTNGDVAYMKVCAYDYDDASGKQHDAASLSLRKDYSILPPNGTILDGVGDKAVSSPSQVWFIKGKLWGSIIVNEPGTTEENTAKAIAIAKAVVPILP